MDKTKKNSIHGHRSRKEGEEVHLIAIELQLEQS